MVRTMFCLGLAGFLLGPFVGAADLEYSKSGISIRLKNTGPFTLYLTKPDGSFVTYLTAGIRDAGTYKVFWNGKTLFGEKLPKGKYKLVLTSGTSLKKDAKFADGAGDIQFTNPVRVNVDSNGDVYVLDVGKYDYKAKKTLGETGIRKLSPNGAFKADFDTADGTKTSILAFPPPKKGVRDLWFDIDSNGDIYARVKWSGVTIFDSKGKLKHRITSDKSGIIPGGYDGTIGDDGRLYLRAFKTISVVDKDKNGGDALILSTDPKKLNIDMPPVIWLYMGPAIEAGRGNALYVTSCKYSLARYDVNADGITKKYLAPMKFKETAGIAADGKGMVYIAERGVCYDCDNWRWKALKKAGKTPSAIYQFLDDDVGLTPVNTYVLKEVVGLRDIALSKDRKSLYVLEDGDDFTTYGAKKNHFSQRGRLGKARLFKYDFAPAERIEKTITVGE